MSSVKVAVRVRPFNKREIELKCSPIVSMVGNKTIIQNPKCNNNGEEEVKEFTFDHSYWSFSEDDPNFATQRLVFEDLGKDIVSDAIEGYNSCIFAYGQTGSGKTHTMMGYSGHGSNADDTVGLIPRICQFLFQQMNSGKNDTFSNRTEISYLEIYNEAVRDLLDPGLSRDNGHDVNGNRLPQLKVREDPKKGPYVEKLSKHVVHSFEDIHQLMKKGNANRCTASTSMNQYSSRSHAIFCIMFSKASYVANNPYETMSKINLVDLAGSERAASTNAQGQRLVEGSHINKSLVTLGNVISALAENCKKGNKKKSFIPYRDSTLTFLLRDSLGGNSKTVMIATISPACHSHFETLNTLRYANRAKNILNKPHINEDANTKLIRELRSEIERLNSMINQNPKLSERLQESEAKVKELTEEWMNKWDDMKEILKEKDFIAIRKSGDFGVVLDSDRPHLIVCVDDDVMSTGVTLYQLNEGITTIGTKFADKKQDILITGGCDVEDEHCIIDWNVADNVVTLHPCNNALCFVNNSQVEGPTVLHQGCFIVFGDNMFRFSNPLEVKSLKQKSSDNNNPETSFLNRSHLINSTSYDSMYNSINSLNKKALVTSFTSTLGLSANDEESEMSTKSSTVSDVESPHHPSSSSVDRFGHINEELDFIKSFLLEWQQAIISKGDGDELNHHNQHHRNILELFLQIVVKIGNDEQFSKDRILQILSFINNLELNDAKGSDEVAIQKVGDYMLEKLNTIKESLKDEIKLDLMNNNEAVINGNSTASSSIIKMNENGYWPVNGYELTNGSGPVIEGLAMTDSTYGRHLSQLASEVDSNLALLSDCVAQLNLSSNSATHDNSTTSATSTTTTTNSTVFTTATQISTNNLEEMIENEVQRRLEMHLKHHEEMYRSGADLSSELSNLNLMPKEILCSTPFLSTVQKGQGVDTHSKPRSLSLSYEELDQIVIYIPSFHFLFHPDPHYEYEIKIGINGDRWTIYRRYRCFLQLHKFIRVQYGNRIKLPYFPPKKWNNKCEKVIETRRRFLENYLQKVLYQCQNLADCPLNYRSKGLEHLDRQCLYNFNTFFQINPLVDKEDLR